MSKRVKVEHSALIFYLKKNFYKREAVVCLDSIKQLKETFV